MATSQVRQNYAKDSEDGVNKQINMELYAMYTYLSMVRLCISVLTSEYWQRFSFHSCSRSPTTSTGMTWLSTALPSTSRNLPTRRRSTPRNS